MPHVPRGRARSSSEPPARNLDPPHTPLLEESLKRFAVRPESIKVVAISGLCRGSFWEDFLRGLKREAESSDATILQVHSEEAHDPAGRRHLLKIADQIQIFVFNSGPFDRNTELIRELRSLGSLVVTSGFAPPVPGCINICLDDVEIGRRLAEAVDRDFKNKPDLRAFALAPREPFDWIPVAIRHEACRRRLQELRPGFRLHRVGIDGGCLSTDDAYAATARALRLKHTSSVDAIVAYFGEAALGAARQIRRGVSTRGAASRRSRPSAPRVYGVDLIEDVIEDMLLDGGTRVWGSVLGADTTEYGSRVLRAGFERYRGRHEVPPSVRIDEVSVDFLSKSRIRTLTNLGEVLGWSDRTDSRVAEKPGPDILASGKPTARPAVWTYADVSYDETSGTITTLATGSVSIVAQADRRAVLGVLFSEPETTVAHAALEFAIVSRSATRARRKLGSLRRMAVRNSAAAAKTGDTAQREPLYGIARVLNTVLKGHNLVIKNVYREGYMLRQRSHSRTSRTPRFARSGQRPAHQAAQQSR